MVISICPGHTCYKPDSPFSSSRSDQQAQRFYNAISNEQLHNATRVLREITEEKGFIAAINTVKAALTKGNKNYQDNENSRQIAVASLRTLFLELDDLSEENLTALETFIKEAKEDPNNKFPSHAGLALTSLKKDLDLYLK